MFLDRDLEGERYAEDVRLLDVDEVERVAALLLEVGQIVAVLDREMVSPTVL
jgi:hypothetical protein